AKQIDNAFQAIEAKNPKLKDVFSSFAFSSHFGKEHSNEIPLRNLFFSISKLQLSKGKIQLETFFDKILFETARLDRKNMGNAIQPQELTELMLSFTPKHNSISVYNPFAGYASFAINLPSNAKYFGQEIDKEIWAIGQMRLLAHSKLSTTVLKCENSINYWPEKEKKDNYQKFDFIVGTLPISSHKKYTEIGNTTNPEQSREELFFLEKALKTLNNTGRAVMVCRLQFLKENGKIKESIIRNDLLEYVIELPSAIFLNNSHPSVLIVLNKAKENKGQVHLLDAYNLFEGKIKNNRKLNISSINSMIEKEEDPNYTLVSINEIIKQNYNLNIQDYLKPASQSVRLENIVEIIQKGPTNINFGTLIKIKDLKNDTLNYNLDIEIIEEQKIPENHIMIDQSCLLFTLYGPEIKPTFFNYSGKPIFISPQIFAAKLKSKDITIPYLISELHADYIDEQLNDLRIGSVAIATITAREFLKTKIEVLPLQEQLTKVDAVREAHIKQKERDLAHEKELLKLKEESFRDFASIRHSLRQLNSAMRSNILGTYEFVSKNNGKSIGLDTLYSKKFEQSFGEHLRGMEETLDLMDRLVKEIGEEREKSTLKLVNLADLLIQVQQRFKKPEIFTFEELCIDHASFMDDSGTESKPLTRIDKQNFNIVFSNIVSNAVEHGFKVPGKNYKIRTALSLSPESSMMILEISNNGHPAPENFSQQDLTTRGEKTSDSKGAGTGGADIKTIVNSFNGEFEWINNPEEDFPVTYIIRLPFINEAVNE
ncbi:MAG: N-6 DNA methylase, partial [bacterium]